MFMFERVAWRRRCYVALPLWRHDQQVALFIDGCWLAFQFPSIWKTLPTYQCIIGYYKSNNRYIWHVGVCKRLHDGHPTCAVLGTNTNHSSAHRIAVNSYMELGRGLVPSNVPTKVKKHLVNIIWVIVRTSICLRTDRQTDGQTDAGDNTLRPNWPWGKNGLLQRVFTS